ncbi:MAG TPA: c-type cytochrome [Gemmatimonadaceae bacterium]|nr:c-type cytochrome [Gemmatimonadaceae bacterium]
MTIGRNYLRTSLLLALSACAVERHDPRFATDTSSAASEFDNATLPTPAYVRRVAFRVPLESEVTDSVMLRSIRRGRALLRYTRDSLRSHVGNRLNCTSCHAQDGTQANAMPWVGVYARFPQYRARSGYVQIIEDRINDCFKRSLNGRPLLPESRDMRDMINYFAFLSLGYPQGAEVVGQGLPPVPPVQGDEARGRTLFAAKCAVCHGVNGQGTNAAPPVWGPQSYNIGAGMARVRTAAAFIKEVMPQNAPRTLSAQEAYDLATYINKKPRPDFRTKERDWPRGDPPPDVAYPTTAAKNRRRTGN